MSLSVLLKIYEIRFPVDEEVAKLLRTCCVETGV